MKLEFDQSRSQTPSHDSSPDAGSIVLKLSKKSRTNLRQQEDETLQKLEGIIEHTESGKSGSLSSGDSVGDI